MSWEETVQDRERVCECLQSLLREPQDCRILRMEGVITVQARQRFHSSRLYEGRLSHWPIRIPLEELLLVARLVCCPGNHQQ